MKILAAIITIILLLFAFFPYAFSQERLLSMTAHALRIDEAPWVLCQPTVKIAFQMPRMVVFSQTRQEYLAVSVWKIYDQRKGDGETSTTWICRDAKGDTALVVLGFVNTDTLGLYFGVTYKDHHWLYRGYPDTEPLDMEQP